MTSLFIGARPAHKQATTNKPSLTTNEIAKIPPKKIKKTKKKQKETRVGRSPIHHLCTPEGHNSAITTLSTTYAPPHQPIDIIVTPIQLPYEIADLKLHLCQSIQSLHGPLTRLLSPKLISYPNSNQISSIVRSDRAFDLLASHIPTLD